MQNEINARERIERDIDWRK